MGEQASLLARNVGNILMPVLSGLLPILNGILIAINSILGALAKIVGFDETSFDYVDDTANSYDNLASSIGGVGSSAKKTKQELSGLRAFDKLNVIKTPTESSGGGGGGSGAGTVNPKLLKTLSDLLGQYDSKLDGVKTKASQIAEDILHWLNFTKQVNPETGEIEWKFNGISGLLKNMWNSFKGLSTTGKILVSLGLLKGLTSLWNVGKKFLALIGNTGMGKAVKNLLTPTKTLTSSIIQWTKANKNLNSGIKDGIEYWRLQNIEVYNTNGSLNKLKTNVNIVKNTLAGLATGAVSLYAVSEAFKSISKEGANAVNVLGAVGGSLGTIMSGIQIGAAFGGYGALIGGVVGILVTATTALMSYKTETDKVTDSINETTNKTNNYVDSLKKQYDSIDENLKLNFQSLGVYSNLIQELQNLTDENGNVKKGYENRVTAIVDLLNKEFNTNLEVKDGVVKNRDDENSAIDDVLKNIDNIIEKKKAEYWLEANKEKYILALQNESDLYSTMLKQQQNREKAEKNLNDAKDKAIRVEKRANKVRWLGTAASVAADAANAKVKKSVEEAQKAYEEAQKAENEATNQYSENQLIRVKYDDMVTANAQNNSDEMKRIYDESTNSYKNANGEYVTSTEDTTKKVTYDAAVRALSQKKYNKEIYDDFIKNLQEQSKSIEDITPDQAAKWRALAQTNETEFMTQMKKLPKDVQQEIVDKMYQQGYQITSEMQKGLDVNKPTIKIVADATSAEQVINSFDTKVRGKRYKVVTQADGNVKFEAYARGGLPSVGQMFIANERGPELVGQIGGQSFVANQNQMMDIIDKKLQNAGGGIKNATFVVQVGSEQIGKVVINDLNKMARNNGKPIVIGG